MVQKVEWIILVTDKYQESYNFYKNIIGFHVEREVQEEEFCQFHFKTASSQFMEGNIWKN